MSTRTDPQRVAACAATLAVLLSACAEVQPTARYAQVQNAVGARLEQNLFWNRDSDEDQRAREAVHRLLDQELTAQRAVQIALLNNRNLQAKLERLGIAQADLIDAGLLENPVLGLTLYSGNAGTIVEASLVQDFVGVISLSARKKVGQAQAERVTLEVSHAVLDLASQVQVQYYSVVGDAQALELARQVVSATEAAAMLAKRQYDAGNMSRRDQTVQQAFYAQTLLDTAQAEARLAADRERLNRLLGLWGTDTLWKMPTRLERVPDTLPTLEQTEGAAVSQRLDLAAAKKEAEAGLQALNLTRQLRYLQPFGIGVAYKREPDLGAFVGPTIELGLPIFDRRQAALARAEAEYRHAQDQVTAMSVEIRSEARAARDRVTAAHDAVRHYENVLLPLQQTIVGETLKLYNGMLVGTYDLLLARQAQMQTAQQYVASVKEFWLAWTELERALGGKVPLIASAEAPQSPADSPESQPHHHGDKP